MLPYQTEFIELLVEYDVIRFGDFTLKSGRKSPYFINAGQLRTGDAIVRLGRAYAKRIREADFECDVVFGPSYKGVPLAVATAIGLAALGKDVGYSFDRKEQKDHGEGGVFVGSVPTGGSQTVVVDDVITSGRSIREAVQLLGQTETSISGVVVAVDRQERGQSDRSTLVELRESVGIPIVPLVTIREIIEHLTGKELAGRVVLHRDKRADIERYLKAHGAPA